MLNLISIIINLLEIALSIRLEWYLGDDAGAGLSNNHRKTFYIIIILPQCYNIYFLLNI